MERYLDLQLMERTSRGVTLTAAGLRLVEHADVILSHLDAAESEARALKGAGGPSRLALGTLPSAAGLVARAAVELLRARPGTDLRIVETDPLHALARLRGGELDVALTFVYDHVEVERPRWLHETPLMQDSIVAVLPERHRLAARAEVRLAELAGEGFVVEPPPERRGFTLAACHAAGFAPEIAASSSDYEVTLALVADGVGVALVPRLAARELPGIAVRDLSEPSLGRRLVAGTRVGTARTPAVAALLGALRRSASEPGAGAA
jgi:DNA-binding transcriptional LysR family regulator